MLFTFLYELTYESPAVRNTIYAQELTKVFFTIAFFYFQMFIFTSWIDSLRKFAIDRKRFVSEYNQRQQAIRVSKRMELYIIPKINLNKICLFEVHELAFA